MNAASRVGNRGVLLLLALLGFAVAAVAAWPWIAGAPLQPASAVRAAAASLGVPPLVAAWLVTGLSALAVLLALVWVARRGRGRTRHAVETPGIHVSTGVVESLIRDSLAAAHDVVGVHASTHLRRGSRVVRLRLQLRSRADVPAVVAHVRSAIADLDRELGEPLPLVAHLSTGVRTVFAHDRRVD